jgi:type VI secretion system secreted protein VgrG
MADELITIVSDVLPDDAHIVSVKGKEGLGELYRFEVGIQTEDGSFDFQAAVRGRATLTFNLGEGAAYQFHGIFAFVEHLHTWDGKTLVRALLVPQLWQATLTRHSRVFIEETVPDILKKVLESSGLTTDDYRLDLQAEYTVIDFVAQYKESNFHFVSRWMEREGMYYFFEQTAAREKLVITDNKAFHQPQPGDNVRYVPLSDDNAMAEQALAAFTCKSRALPATVELTDYDYINPSLDLVGNATVSSDGFGEISSFGDNFLTVTEGNRLATLRAEEFLARKNVFAGRGRVFHLRPGFKFTLEEHPRDAFNAVYLATSLEHTCNQSATQQFVRDMLGIDFEDEYSISVVAIPEAVQFRSPDRFAWPRIEGYEVAVVCGKAQSPYAQIDEHGRYRVRIKFDESDLDDGAASTWVRMQQPHGGTNEGWHFPLRKGTEVLLFFQGGDPDRPVIAGVVPNAHTPSPVVTNNYTTNIIQTGGMNLVVFEDNSGQQYIYQYCPTQNTYLHMGFERNEYNIELNTDGHAHFHFGGDQVIDIDLTLTENVTHDVTLNYNQNFELNVIDNWNIDIRGLKYEHVNLSVELAYDNDYSLTILGIALIEIPNNNWEVHVGGDVKFDFDSTWDIKVDGKVTQEFGDFSRTGHANETDLILGNKLTTKSVNDTNITYGLQNDMFFGMKNELNIASKNGITIGAEIGAFLGLKGEFAMSLNLKIVGGAYIEADSTVKMMTASVLLENALGPRLKNASISLAKAATHILL